MKISLGCDEAAFDLKEAIKKHLEDAGHEVVDNGVGPGEVELYPDVAVRTCEKVTSNECDRGILVCGTGIGMAMTANKVPGIRAAVCHLSILNRALYPEQRRKCDVYGSKSHRTTAGIIFTGYLDGTYLQRRTVYRESRTDYILRKTVQQIKPST